MIGNGKVSFTGAAGEEDSGGDWLKQVSLVAILGSGRWRQMWGSDELGQETYRLCPSRIEELDSCKRMRESAYCWEADTDRLQ